MPHDKLWLLCIFQSRQFVSCIALRSRVSKWHHCFIGSALGSYFGLLCITHYNSMSSAMAILGPPPMEKACLTYASWTLSDLAATLFPLPSMSQKPRGSFSLLITYQLLHQWPTQATYLCLNTKSKIAYTTAALVIPMYLSAHCALQVSNDCNIIMAPSTPPIIDDFSHCQSCPSRYI